MNVFDVSDDSDDLFRDALVFTYTDDQAIEDGVLKPFIVNGRDTRHRITGNAYEALTEHHRPAHPQCDEAQFMRFYLAELLPLVPEAVRVWRDNVRRQNEEILGKKRCKGRPVSEKY